MRLELELKSDRAAPGGLVAGRIDVIEGGASRSLTLMLTLHERTSHFDVIAHSSAAVVHRGDLVTGQSFDFEIAVPPEAPPSVKTEHAELSWDLDLKSDEPGLDSRIGRRIEVV